MRRRAPESPAVYVPLGASTFEEFFAAEYPRIVPVLHALLGDRVHAESAAASLLNAMRRRWDEVEADDDLGRAVLRTAVETSTGRWWRPAPSATAHSGGSHDDRKLPDRDLWDAVNRLPRTQRAALVLHYVAQLPLGEVAAVVRCSPTALTSQLTKAVDALDTRSPNDDEGNDRLLPEPPRGRREQIDARLRTSGSAVAAMAPTEAEAARALSEGVTLHRRRRRRWIVPVGIAAGSIACTLAVAALLGRNGPEAAVDLAPTESTTSPSTSDAPPTTVEETTTTGRTRVIEPVPDYEATYDTPTGLMWISSEWNWDGEGGSCITVSQESEPPQASELVPPRAFTGCVDGSRDDTVLTTRLGDRLVHLDKGSSPKTWEMSSPPSRGMCDSTADQPSLREGSLYEITCTSSEPLVRRFPDRPARDLILVRSNGSEFRAAQVYDGDANPDELSYPDYGPAGLRLFRPIDRAGLGDCVLATVERQPGWFEGCADFERPGGFLLTTPGRDYVISHDSGRLTAFSAERTGGEEFGCAPGVVEALGLLDQGALWSGLRCSGNNVAAAYGGTVSGELPGPGGDGLVVGRVGEGELHRVRHLEPGELVNETGRLRTLPVVALSPWGFDGGQATVDDVTNDVRQIVDLPDDLASIGDAVSEHRPGAEEPRPTDRWPDDFWDVIVGDNYLHDGAEFRTVITNIWDMEDEGRTVTYVTWVTRTVDDDLWDVAASFCITTCRDPQSGNPVRCE